VTRRLVVLALVTLPLALGAEPAWAQCAMCKTALLNSAEGRGISQQFNYAILVMLFAPYLVFAAIAAVLLRHRMAAAFRRWAREARARLSPTLVPRVH